MKAFNKMVRRSVTRSLGRFVAIIAIVALGVGFLTGLLASTPNMKKSVDSYYDKYNAADINLKKLPTEGELFFAGFSAEELGEIKKTDGVFEVEELLITDVPIAYKEATPIARVHYFDFSTPNAGSINRLEIIDGRLPKTELECLVERGGSYMYDIKAGEKLSANGIEYTVSGVVGNSWYFSNEREPTNVGNGRLGAAIYIDKTPMIVSDLFITVVGAKTINSFSARYTDMVNAVSDKVGTSGRLALTREKNMGYISFKTNAEKVQNVAVVFPAFFFLVAALVSLTTMTRMVEEERTQIGTLRAMGYSKGKIASKYLVYSLLAAVIGCVVGVLCGFQLLPAIVWNAFKVMFHLPPLTVSFNLMYAGISSLVAVISILLATLGTVMKTLKEKPGQLLQPKSPKPGKRILLERMPILWNRLKFKHKSAMRNLFRYKKHFFMTVIGIAGCTALILTGFGLADSVNSMASTHFDKIAKYDLSVNYSTAPDDDLSALIASGEVVGEHTRVYTESGYIVGEDDKFAINIIVPESSAQITKFVTLRKRVGKKDIPFNDTSAVITEKIATELKLKVGDTANLESVSGKGIGVEITGICENYVGSTIYIGRDILFNSPNTLLAFSGVTGEVAQDEAMTRLYACNSVTGAEFSSVRRATYKSLLSSISFIVIVLVIAAGGLAVIVLYNLINININERAKELATLKVLGYRNLEVAGYVYRETIIMTIVGVLVGFLLGWLLHVFVINVGESVDMMFGRIISPLSFLYSGLLTIGFAALVDFIMFFKIKRINMIDSMKAAD